MSSQVTRANEQQLGRHTGQAQRVKQVDEREVEAKASANAGLNLNLAGAISGIFSGKKNKKTDTDADGTSHSTENSTGRGYVEGSGVGTLDAVGSGENSVTERQRRTVEGTQEQIDHLGLSDRKMVEGAARK